MKTSIKRMHLQGESTNAEVALICAWLVRVNFRSLVWNWIKAKNWGEPVLRELDRGVSAGRYHLMGKVR